MNTILISTITGIKPVVSLYSYSIGYSPQEISMIIAASAFFPALLAFRMGKMIDHFGTRPMIILGNVMLIVALWLSIMSPSLIIFLVQQSMVGIASTCIMLCLQKRVGGIGGKIDQIVANYSLSGSMGAMIGPVVSSYIYDVYGYQSCVWFNISIISFALVSELGMRNADGENQSTFKDNQEVELVKRESIWSLMRNRDLRNAILIGALLFSSRDLFNVYFPLLAENMGITPTITGILLSVCGLTMLVIRFSQTILIRFYRRMTILTWSIYLTGFIYLVVPFSSGVTLLFVLIGLLGAGLGLGQPLSTAAVLEATLPERRGEILGAQMAVNRITQFAIPLIFGGIGGLVGVSTIFWASGLVLLIFGYLTRSASEESADKYRGRNF